jgi:short-subunit dehydrogenase
VRLGRDTRVLITGASRGIGRATAEQFAARGCVLGLVARSGNELEQLADELTPRAAGVTVLTADIADADEISKAISNFVDRSGGLDVLVANAGVAYYGSFGEYPIEEAEQMTRVNWMGTVYTVAAALPHMRARRGGRIVVVSSAAGHRAFPQAAVYGATKFAQRGFLEALHHELAGTGIAVTGVYPGAIETSLHDHARTHDRVPEWRQRGVPASVVGQAIVEGVEKDRRAVFVPGNTRLLSVLHGISPKLADRMLRRVAGRAAAPAD